MLYSTLKQCTLNDQYYEFKEGEFPGEFEWLQEFLNSRI